GYWRRDEETARALLPGGWLRTGDGGSLDEDGYLYLHDRLKDMIITGGENVFPAEVESVLTGHPAIAEVAVVGVPSETWGESAYAVVVLRPGQALSEGELVAWSRERMAHFKCPVGMRTADALPRNASGKLLKAKLRAELATS
ncbi:MAG: AMP-binding protein, partial [Frankiales bacterium]|nr:AMP-binding protein [Frankiales bacterium]